MLVSRRLRAPAGGSVTTPPLAGLLYLNPFPPPSWLWSTGMISLRRRSRRRGKDEGGERGGDPSRAGGSMGAGRAHALCRSHVDRSPLEEETRPSASLQGPPGPSLRTLPRACPDSPMPRSPSWSDKPRDTPRERRSVRVESERGLATTRHHPTPVRGFAAKPYRVVFLK